jgi:ribosome biogenesis GTPase
MSKRRINKQQSARIEQRQQQYRQKSPTEQDSINHDGLVITRHQRHALIENSDKTRVLCFIRPNIDALVAGDRVIWRASGHRQGSVISLYPRNSILGRPDKHGRLRPVAANITQLIIVVAPKPDISWVLLDSYLVMAEHLKIQPCILLNKTDITCDAIQKTLLEHYETLGYSVLFANRNDNNAASIETMCAQHVSVFVGQSGVGKSSLIARILPEEAAHIQTAELSTISELGCHTTSNSYFYHLPSGGALIDSPGVREFGLWHMPAADILHGFCEFRRYPSQCKFRNCNHHNTPGCALLNAVKNKWVTQQRYENYVKISAHYTK